jgi:hypothetical protein
MEHIVGVDNSLLVKWKLLRNDGKPFSVEQYACRLFVLTSRGRDEIANFSVSGPDKNIVSWQMNDLDLRFIGSCSLAMSINRRGKEIARVEYRDAFRVSHRSPKDCDCNQRLEISSFVNVIHPEELTGNLTVLFPEFEIDDNMHLIMLANTDQFNSNFTLDERGHLFYQNN